MEPIKTEVAGQAAQGQDRMPDGIIPGDVLSIDGKTRLRVRKVCAYDLCLLRKLESPIIKELDRNAAIAAGKEAGPNTPFTDEDCYEMIYLLTRPPVDARATFKKGREAFREAALAEIGCQFGLFEINRFSDDVQKAMGASFTPSEANLKETARLAEDNLEAV